MINQFYPDTRRMTYGEHLAWKKKHEVRMEEQSKAIRGVFETAGSSFQEKSNVIHVPLRSGYIGLQRENRQAMIRYDALSSRVDKHGINNDDPESLTIDELMELVENPRERSTHKIHVKFTSLKKKVKFLEEVVELSKGMELFDTGCHQWKVYKYEPEAGVDSREDLFTDPFASLVFYFDAEDKLNAGTELLRGIFTENPDLISSDQDSVPPPRFSRLDAEIPNLSFTRGNGDLKKAIREYNPDLLNEIYDASQNYSDYRDQVKQTE